MTRCFWMEVLTLISPAWKPLHSSVPLFPARFFSDLVNKLIKWSSTSFVKANAPLCKHVFKICFPALVGCLLESSSTQKGFERLIWFLAPFFFFCSLCLLAPLLELLSVLSFKPSGMEGGGGGITGWLWNGLISQLFIIAALLDNKAPPWVIEKKKLLEHFLCEWS